MSSNQQQIHLFWRWKFMDLCSCSLLDCPNAWLQWGLCYYAQIERKSVRFTAWWLFAEITMWIIEESFVSKIGKTRFLWWIREVRLPVAFPDGSVCNYHWMVDEMRLKNLSFLIGTGTKSQYSTFRTTNRRSSKWSQLMTFNIAYFHLKVLQQIQIHLNFLYIDWNRQL